MRGEVGELPVPAAAATHQLQWPACSLAACSAQTGSTTTSPPQCSRHADPPQHHCCRPNAAAPNASLPAGPLPACLLGSSLPPWRGECPAGSGEVSFFNELVDMDNQLPMINSVAMKCIERGGRYTVGQQHCTSGPSSASCNRGSSGRRAPSGRRDSAGQAAPLLVALAGGCRVAPGWLRQPGRPCTWHGTPAWHRDLPLRPPCGQCSVQACRCHGSRGVGPRWGCPGCRATRARCRATCRHLGPLQRHLGLLQRHQLGVVAVPGHQLHVGAALNHPAALQDVDGVGALDRAQPAGGKAGGRVGGVGAGGRPGAGGRQRVQWWAGAVGRGEPVAGQW